jgi:hypothetical protein
VAHWQLGDDIVDQQHYRRYRAHDLGRRWRPRCHSGICQFGSVGHLTYDRDSRRNRRRHPGQIDWKQQFDKALEAFNRNGFFILTDDKQAETLDQEFTVGPGMQVSFVKLTLLVGG